MEFQKPEEKGFQGRVHRRDCLCQRELISQEGSLTIASCETSVPLWSDEDKG